MLKILSMFELSEIENRIEAINFQLDFLDPTNPHDAKTIESFYFELDSRISTLEIYYKKARIREIGLRII